MEQVVRKERNRTIDVIRLVYIMVIVFFHFYEPTNEHFVLGWVATSMFFLISGLFMFEKLEKQGNSSIYIYIRYKRFFAYTAIATIMLYVEQLAMAHYLEHVEWINLKGDILLPDLILDIFSIGTQKVILGTFPYLPPEWSISAMLIVECLIYIFWVSLNERTRNIIAPGVLIISIFPLINGGTHNMFFQAAVPICLGYLALLGSKKIKILNLNQTGRVCFTIVEVICNLAAICILTFAQNTSFYFLCLPVFAIIVSISYSGVSYIEELCKKMKVTKYFGEYSMGIYLIHWIPHMFFLRIYADPYERYSHKFVFIVAVLVLAAVYCVFVKFVIFLGGRIKKVCKFALISSDKKIT